jgi:hypothetical protein
MRTLLLVVVAFLAGCTPCLGPRVCPVGSAPEAEAALPGWTSSPPAEHIPSYNFDDILEAMRLSYIAYDSTGDSIAALGPETKRIEVDTIRLSLGGPGLFRYLTGVRALVWHSPEKPRVYVAIRGTDNLGNIVLDVLYGKGVDTTLGVFVHRPTKSVVDRLIDQVRDSVDALLRDGDALWITGHSLGGAGATLMYLRFYEEKRFPLGPLYTFGNTRVLDTTGVRKYRCLIPHVRVVNWSDPAPHLPPSRDECLRPLDPGCNGLFAQLGDELVIVDSVSAWTRWTCAGSCLTCRCTCRSSTTTRCGHTSGPGPSRARSAVTPVSGNSCAAARHRDALR